MMLPSKSVRSNWIFTVTGTKVSSEDLIVSVSHLIDKNLDHFKVEIKTLTQRRNSENVVDVGERLSLFS
jgi:hypothetical protein